MLSDANDDELYSKRQNFRELSLSLNCHLQKNKTK